MRIILTLFSKHDVHKISKADQKKTRLHHLPVCNFNVTPQSKVVRERSRSSRSRLMSTQSLLKQGKCFESTAGENLGIAFILRKENNKSVGSMFYGIDLACLDCRHIDGRASWF